uniref:Uncharacterized protein n=1 Tax=Daphnia galeata TaxID=27404 RepID=A0A8J2RR93_9CRUS|nr:unnamed protein product [Daphnia galeata]
MATQSSLEVQQGKVYVIEISRVIDSDDITRNLSIKLQWDKNFAGLIPSDPEKKLQEIHRTGEFEGIQTEDVALTIAKFEHQVCGNVLALVQPDRIAKQLVPITKLAEFFLRFHCFDGVKTVGDCISSLYAEMDPSLAWQSKCFDVEAVVDMLVALESNPETSSRKRIQPLEAIQTLSVSIVKILDLGVEYKLFRAHQDGGPK